MAKRSKSVATAAKSSPVKSKKSQGKAPLWTFPKNTLEMAISIPKAIEEQNAGHAMKAEELAKAVGFKKANDWRFQNLLRSANLYGLVSGSGSGATVHLEEIGRNLVAPSSPQQRREALRSAFRNVEDFRKVEDHYGNKRLPQREFFLNTLTQGFNIPRERVEAFADVFTSNLAFLKSFAVEPSSDKQPVSADSDFAYEIDDIDRTVPAAKEQRVRRFLDTCFVMMPFGAWFDRYYQEIFVPAIRAASLEPVRADELFTTGSVVEQIWEQIEKAKVLLADLTGKNANVFYELGLAHAARRPVVFTSANIDDVPFDLRHLRVIVYEVREPEWASKLRKSITDYLHNTIKEPAKSIPHPFREIAAHGHGDSGSDD